MEGEGEPREEDGAAQEKGGIIIEANESQSKDDRGRSGREGRDTTVCEPISVG